MALSIDLHFAANCFCLASRDTNNSAVRSYLSIDVGGTIDKLLQEQRHFLQWIAQI